VLTRAIADPATRVLVVGGGELVVGDEGAALLDPATARRVAGSGDQGADDERWLLLGRDGEGAHGPLVVARRVARGGPAPRTGQPSDVLVHRAARSGTAGSSGGGDGEPEPLPGLRWAHLRDVGATLSARDAGLATMAVALDAWHARHPRCPRCGERTVPAQGGWVRVCSADGSEHYPRTDPAVIVAVVDDADRLLLGHNAAWPEGRYSTLAGFVEAGESAEHAVRREVEEETGVVVDAVEYRGSQPWPFPASLMLAYRGHAATIELRVDGVEVTAARWLTRDELAEAVRAGELLLPMGSSVAHALISEWFGAPLPTAP
jgi:NAD+ diphosphatase